MIKKYVCDNFTKLIQTNDITSKLCILHNLHSIDSSSLSRLFKLIYTGVGVINR